MKQDTTKITSAISHTAQEAYFSCTDFTCVVEKDLPQQLGRNEKIKKAVNDLHIGKRIYNELKDQGRTVTWLASQLCMERTSLYYTFRQNSIDMELLLRISAFLGHNFIQDIADVYKSYEL